METGAGLCLRVVKGGGDDSTHYSTTCHLWAHIYWEGRGCKKEKKKKTARQCGSGLGRNYIMFKADEFVRCRMLKLPGF